jgi:hypothetical protein
MSLDGAARAPIVEKMTLSYADHTFSGRFSSHLVPRARALPQQLRFRLSRFSNSKTEGFPRIGLYLASRSRRLAQ